MKSAVLIIALVAACSSWRHNDVEAWNYQVQYTSDCSLLDTMYLEGTYQNKNKYMQNPSVACTDSTLRFSVISLTINDTITLSPDSMASSAFEIPLMDYGFKTGDPLKIRIVHYAMGRPKMLNPEVYKPQ